MFKFRVKRTVLLFIAAMFFLAHIVLYFSQIYSYDNTEDDNAQDNNHYMDNGKDNERQRTIKPTISIKTIDELDQHNVVFRTLSKAQFYMKSVTDIRQSKRIIIQYSNFSRHLPNFITEKDFEIFMRSERNTENLSGNKYELLRGVVEIIPNATFKMDYECGFKSDSSYLREPRIASQFYESLVPLVIPMGFLFQHFFDGTLPKIIQAFEFIKRPEVKILMERPSHNNVYHILEKLGITKEKIVWHQRSDSSTVYHANHMLFTCVAPPLHPLLWKQLRHILGIKDTLQTTLNNSYVIYLTRQGATNGGRIAINENKVTEYLSKRYRNRFLIFTGNYDFEKAVKVFSKVSVIIGTHGGAFYNLNYAPLSTTVIEFGPVVAEGRDIPSLPHAIFWAMADMTGQKYWRVPCRSMNYQHDMNIDIHKLKMILDKTDIK